jgi:hypothetical protein
VERCVLSKSPMPSPRIIRNLRGMVVSFRKPHRMTFYGMLMRPWISILDSP